MERTTKASKKHIHVEILTESEAARLLRCNTRTLQRARLAGKPVAPFRFVGDRAMYSRDAILAAFAQGE